MAEQDVGVVVVDCDVDLGESWEFDWADEFVFAGDGEVELWDGAVYFWEIEISCRALGDGDVWCEVFDGESVEKGVPGDRDIGNYIVVC